MKSNPPIPKVTLERLELLGEMACDILGEDAQWGQMQEECAELILAVSKYRRARVKGTAVYNRAEEVADVLLMVLRCRQMAGCELVDQIAVQKLDRLERNIENGELT